MGRPRSAPPYSSLSNLTLAFQIWRLAADLKCLDHPAQTAAASFFTTLARPRIVHSSPSASNKPHASSNPPKIAPNLREGRRTLAHFSSRRPSLTVFLLSQIQRCFASTALMNEVPKPRSELPETDGPSSFLGQGRLAPNLQPYWHWLCPEEPTIDTLLGANVEAELIATIRSSEQFFNPAMRKSNLRRQRRMNSEDLWRKYQQHAHRASVPMSARLMVAEVLSQNILRITANMESRGEFKVLRFATGRRIAAIASDCETFLSADPAKAPPVSAVLRLATLFVRALALQCQPNQAMCLIDKTLQQLWPQISLNRHVSDDPNFDTGDLKAVDRSLQVIADSMIFDLKYRTTLGDIQLAEKRSLEFCIDPSALDDIFKSRALPSVPTDPAQTCLNSLLDSSYTFLFDHRSFVQARVRLMRGLALITDINDKLPMAVGARSWTEPNVQHVSDLCIRAHLLYGSKDIALDVVDLLWKNGVSISDPLLFRLIRTASGPPLTSRIERIIQRFLAPKDYSSTGKNLKKLSYPVLKGIAMFWASQGRFDRAQHLVSEVIARNDPKDRNFKQLVEIELAAARGETSTLKALLSNKYDLDAVLAREVLPDKQLLDSRAVALLLKGHTRANELEAAEDLFSKVLDMRLPLCTSYFNSIIDMQVRRSNIDEAVSIFEQMQNFGVVPNKVTYTLIISGFGLRKDAEGAAHALRAMVAAKVRPDRITYTSLLNCYVQSGLFAAAVDLFRWMQYHPEPSFRPTIEICNIMLKAYVGESFPIQDVLKFVATVRERGLEPDSHTFALMLQSASDAGAMDIAEELFTEAERQLPSPPDCPPGQGANRYHFTIMIHGYLRRGNHAEAKKYFDEMRDRGIQPSAITWSILVSSYANSDNEVNYDLACSLVAQLIEDEAFKAHGQSHWRVPVIRPGLPFEALFAPLLVAQARRGEPEEAEQTMSSLMQTGTGASLTALTPLLDAYRKAGQVEKGMELFNRIYADALALARSHKHRLYGHADSVASDSPSHVFEPMSTNPKGESRREDVSSRNLLCLPISIMIDMLAKADRHADVAKVWSRATADGFGFDSHNWNHLAASMARAGQLDEALSVVEQVLFHPPPSWQSFEALREERDRQRFREDQRDTHVPVNYQGQDPYMFDPLTMSLTADPSQSNDPDRVETPSRPPNRRHEIRLDDDPYAPLPFDPSPRRQRTDDSDTGYDLQDLRQPSAYRIDSKAGDALTRPLTQSMHKLSPWYAQFGTMTAISLGLAKLENHAQVARLAEKHPKAAKLLEAHEAKVEYMEDRSQRSAERTARRLIDGTHWSGA